MVSTNEMAVKGLTGLPAGMCETFLEWWGRTRRTAVSPSSEIDSLKKEQILNQIVKAQVRKDMEKIIIKVWIDVGSHHGYDQDHCQDMGWCRINIPDAQRWVRVYLKRRVRRPQRPACRRPHPHSTCLKAKIWPNLNHGNSLEIMSFRFHESVSSITLNDQWLKPCI